MSSSTLATSLARKASGMVNGFVIELATAGGHNAPPRGPMQISDRGEPVYGPRDCPDMEAIHALGRPFQDPQALRHDLGSNAVSGHDSDPLHAFLLREIASGFPDARFGPTLGIEGCPTVGSGRPTMPEHNRRWEDASPGNDPLSY